MRLVDARRASMTECKTTLTRAEVLDMNDWLDAQEEAEFAARPDKRGR
jgi:hypothetical protein